MLSNLSIYVSNQIEPNIWKILQVFLPYITHFIMTKYRDKIYTKKFNWVGMFLMLNNLISRNCILWYKICWVVAAVTDSCTISKYWTYSSIIKIFLLLQVYRNCQCEIRFTVCISLKKKNMFLNTFHKNYLGYSYINK